MFYSILFPSREQHETARRNDPPDCLKDLNLDQVFMSIRKNTEEFELDRFFFTPLNHSGTIMYRQEVMRALEDEGLRKLLAAFSGAVCALGKNMEGIQKALASDDLYSNNYLTRGRMLQCAERYCCEVDALANALGRKTYPSVALRDFTQYLAAYQASEAFGAFRAHIHHLRTEFAKVEYCMLIKNGTIRVRKYEGQEDQSQQILALFEKFRQGDASDYRQKLREEPYAAHVEAATLNLVASFYKELFSDLNGFCANYRDFPDEIIVRFSREVQFYLAWFDYIQPLREAGLPFTYPQMSGTVGRIYDRDGFDLALASATWGKVVTNDFELVFPERIIVVTGPNQGGKTTFARAFGQIHYLAALGLCVPGREASLFLFDNILTHFGREEDLTTLNGKLQDDLMRLHALLIRATSTSIIIINEIFASTTLADALALGGHMMDSLAALKAPAVVVTFLDELAAHGEETVSMMSTVRADDPAQRTYKIVRKPPDGLAYAIYLAGKHGLTYDQLNGRLKA